MKDKQTNKSMKICHYYMHLRQVFIIFWKKENPYLNDNELQYAVSEQKSYLVILDAKRIGETNAMVARLEVPKYLNFPLGFHGVWASNNSKT